MHLHCQFSCALAHYISPFFLFLFSRTIYHFDPANLPPNHKLPSLNNSMEPHGTRKKVRTQIDPPRESDGKMPANSDELVKPDIEISSMQSDDSKCEPELALIEQSNNETNTVLCSLSQLEINPKLSDVVVTEDNVEGTCPCEMCAIPFYSLQFIQIGNGSDNYTDAGEPMVTITHLTYSPSMKSQATSPNIPDVANLEVN